MTTGETLAAELRRYLSVGTRTKRYRDRRDLHTAMAEAVMYAAQYPGYFTERTQEALRTGFGAALAYEKHVRGYRIDGTLAQQVNAMTAWRFAGLLGEMVDANVTCTGDGERFFAAMAREMHTAAVAS